MSVTVWGARIMVGIIEPHSPVKNSMCKRWDTPKVDLPEGKEGSVTILETPAAKSDGLKRSAGAWKGLVDAEKLIENIYANRRISTRPVPRL